MSETIMERLGWRWLPALAFAYLAAALATFPVWTVDDAYITYRYAENLALHGELTWNVGEDPVEGYTGVLLPLLLATARVAGVEVDLASKAVGVASLFATGVVLYAFLRSLGVRRSVRGAVLVLFATAPMLLVHALSGLETLLFTVLVLASCYAIHLCLAHSNPSERTDGRAVREALCCALLLLASLTRPEGVVLAALGAAAVATARWREGKGLGGFLLRFLLVFVVPAAGYFAWRYAYYGQLLPNTYYAKWVRRVHYDSLHAAAAFAAKYVALPLGGVGFVGLIMWRDVLRIARRETPGGPTLIRFGAPLVGLFFTAIVCAQYTRSALIMNYSHRFFAPFYPIFLVWAGLLWEAVATAREQRRDASSAATRAAPRREQRRDASSAATRAAPRREQRRATARRCSHWSLSSSSPCKSGYTRLCSGLKQISRAARAVS